MKQKIVLKVILKDEKLYSKTLGLAASIPGVRSVALEGYDKLTVCGDGVDVAKLVTKIREGNHVKKCKWWKFCSCCKKKEKKEGVGLVIVDSVEEDKPKEKKEPCLYPPFQYEVMETGRNPNHFLPPYFLPFYGAPGNGSATSVANDGAAWWNMWQGGEC